MEPSRRLDELIGGFRATQIIRTAAILGVADALSAGPLASPDVAATVGADGSFVRRLLRCLAALGLLTESEEGRFANTELGELLRSDIPGSMKSTAVGRTEDSWWAAWAQLPTAAVTGAVPYEVANGHSLWDELRSDPQAAVRFNAFMASKTTRFLAGLLEQYDFSHAQQIVDVGGGSGALLAGILQAVPQARGTVFDLDSGLTDTQRLLTERGVQDRCEVVAGTFFDRIPGGGDVYILRQILHDWPDPRVEDILASCRRSMRPGAELVVIDRTLPERATEGPESREGFEFDLFMFVMFGARERTERELVDCITAAGFTVDRVLPTEPERTIVCFAG